MPQVHRIACSEIWGGNRADELLVETSGIRGCLYSRGCEGGKGGDIYYFSVCGSDLLTRIAIADVVGHGEAVSETSQWLYDSLARQMNSADGATILSDLNTSTVERGLDAMSTASVAAFYRENSNFYYSYAGHHEILLRRRGQDSWQRLAAPEHDRLEDLPLGVSSECKFQQHSVHVDIGDRLLLYSDGLIEAMDQDGQQFGTDALCKVLESNGGKDLSAIRGSLLESLLEHTDGKLDHDDVTFMLIEIANVLGDGSADD